MSKQKILAIIPARAGSKGIKNKNLTLLNGKPLIYYSIESAKNSEFINKIVVTSDGKEILDYAKSLGVDILKRPKSLAQDYTTSDKVVLHTLKKYPEYDAFILLQPTSPMRSTQDIDSAILKFKNVKSCNALISVKECDNKFLKAFTVQNGKNLKPVADEKYPFTPRQKLPKTYLSNGAIYIVKTKKFLENPSFYQPNTQYYLMNEQSSIDIDSLEDIQMVELFI